MTDLAALKHPDRAVRLEALARLQPLLAHDVRVQEAVIELAEKDESTRVRIEAIRALKCHRVLEAQEVLARIACAEYGDEANVAIEALAELDTPDSVRALAVVARQNAADLVRRKAAFCLGCTRHVELAIEALERVLVDRSKIVREAAIISLGTLGGDRAVALLGKRLALEKDHEMLITIIKALGRSRTLSAQYYLLQALPLWREDVKLAEALAEALGNVGDERAFPALVELARSEPLPTYMAAMQAMARIIVRLDRVDLALAHPDLTGNLSCRIVAELKDRPLTPQMRRFLIFMRHMLQRGNNSVKDIDALLQRADSGLER